MVSQERNHQTVFFVRRDDKEKLNYFKDFCSPLWGEKNLRVDQYGHIFYATWRNLPKAGMMLPPDHVALSHLNPSADIYAQHSRHDRFSEVCVHEITDDGGSIEAAIRSVDYILLGEQTWELPQAQAIDRRTLALLDLFSGQFFDLSEDEWKQAQQNTQDLLKSVRLNPQTVISEEKKRIADWLTKASGGLDSLDRPNKLITLCALAAAHRQAIERQRKIGGITAKYIRMREVLLFEREASRAALTGVCEHLKPEALPAHCIFKYPDRQSRPSDDIGVIRLIYSIEDRLKIPHAKPYRTSAQRAIPLLQEIVTHVSGGNRRIVGEKNLFEPIHQLLQENLDAYANIYPSEST